MMMMRRRNPGAPADVANSGADEENGSFQHNKRSARTLVSREVRTIVAILLFIVIGRSHYGKSDVSSSQSTPDTTETKSSSSSRKHYRVDLSAQFEPGKEAINGFKADDKISQTKQPLHLETNSWNTATNKSQTKESSPHQEPKLILQPGINTTETFAVRQSEQGQQGATAFKIDWNISENKQSTDETAQALIKTSYNTSQLCSNLTSVDTQRYAECGQLRLLDEYGTGITLESLEVNPNNSTGSAVLSLCQPGCSDKFNASDMLLWIRFQSPEALFSVTARAVDCRSWRADFEIPIEGKYQVDARTMWLHGDPNSWISDIHRVDTTKRGVTWNGTPYVLPRGPRLHGGYERDARWMRCADWCIMHRGCTHWTLRDFVRGMVHNTEKCKLFSNVTGYYAEKGAVSGSYPPEERRVKYLGGLSIPANNLETKQTCRAQSHVLGSPTELHVPISRNGQNLAKRLSDLPWCTTGGSSDKGGAKEGFWASTSAVYPTMASDSCPERCTKNPPRHLMNATAGTVCTPVDTLQGICAFNDGSPVYSTWHTGSLDTAEPQLKDLAWVEQDCRYRLGNAELFKQCLHEKEIDVIILQANDIFGELLDRWQLGRVDEWARKAWTQNFTYKAGEDWLVPVGSDVVPVQLRRHWESRGNHTNVPLTAIVIQHLWKSIGPRLYNNHDFEKESFKKSIREQIAAWQKAVTEGWLSQDSKFVLILSPVVHEFFGDPFYTYEVMEYFNGIAKPIYEANGWHIVDAMAMTRARPDYRFLMSWWNAESHVGEKRSGCGVVYAITNVLFNTMCSSN